MQKGSLKPEYPYIVFLQAVSSVAVITLHTNGCFWAFRPEPYWFSANVIECLFYFGVPVFFMISGITLIDYPLRCSTKEFFIRRIRKAVIPFLAWSAIALCWFGQARLLLHPITVLDLVFSTRILAVYWFFPVLFCIYLSMPMFAALPRDRRREILSYLLIAGFTVNSLIPFLLDVLRVKISWPFSVPAVSGALLYVPAGVLLHEHDLTKKQCILIYGIGLAALMAHICGTACLSVEAGEIVETFKGYYNVPGFLYSLAGFVFLRQIGERIMRTRAASLIRLLAGYSFPLYLMHMFVILAVNERFHPDTLTLLYRLGMPWLILIAVIPVTWIIRKIPVLRCIVPR